MEGAKGVASLETRGAKSAGSCKEVHEAARHGDRAEDAKVASAGRSGVDMESDTANGCELGKRDPSTR